MSARLTRQMEDHHRTQRLHALRGYARPADRLDGRDDITWVDVACVLVAWLIFALPVFLYFTTN